ncbi:MAG: chemotaxis protein CheA [Spirochaetia bacterium]
MSDYLDPNNEELLKDFFIEAELQIDTLEQNILVLENDPGEKDSIDEIFRAAHTLKGAAATVQMTQLSEFTHLVEDVLDGIRSGETTADEELIDLLLRSIDVIKEMLQTAKDGTSYDRDISDIKDGLRALLGRKQEGDKEKTAEPSGKREDAPEPQGAEQAQRTEQIAESAQPGEGDQGAASSAQLTEYDLLELGEAADTGEQVFQIRVSFNKDHPMNSIGGVQVFAALKDLGTVLKTIPDFEELYEDVFHPEIYYYISTASGADAIEKKLDLPDVITAKEITPLEKLRSRGDTGGKSPSEEPRKAQEPQQQEPQQERAQEKEPKEAKAGESAPRKKGEEPLAGKAEGTGKTEGTGKAEEAGKKTEGAGKAAAKETGEAEKKQPEGVKEQELRKSGASSSILRVESKRIDDLLNLVSEAVITKARFSQISQKFSEAQNDMSQARQEYYESLKELFDSLPEYLKRIQEGETVKKIKADIVERFDGLYTIFDSFENQIKTTVDQFNSTAQNLSRNTSDLQEGVMQIRMVPISQIFNRFPRLVRDVSKDLKKKVKLDMEGEDTELDKSIIEDLLDPLIHCVRNSIDHGIESPEERKKAGKPEQGNVFLKASNEGNMIIIEIEDDGKGIDVESVYRKAVDRGLIHENKKLSDVEAFNLIFEPGFSTAKSVTNLSGRGVGLDVVKRQIEKLNGSVSVWSEVGLGSRITIKIPLTLAIIQGLLIRVGKEIYAVPITSVLDSHRIKASDIRMIDNYEVFNVREDVISLIRLSRLFNIPTDNNREYSYVVIVGSGEKKMGLMIDSLIGEEDVVIKPLRDKYTNVPGIAGATILGDGTVALIIDVSQLLDLGLRQEIENRKRRATQITGE